MKKFKKIFTEYRSSKIRENEFWEYPRIQDTRIPFHKSSHECYHPKLTKVHVNKNALSLDKNCIRPHLTQTLPLTFKRKPIPFPKFDSSWTKHTQENSMFRQSCDQEKYKEKYKAKNPRKHMTN